VFVKSTAHSHIDPTMVGRICRAGNLPACVRFCRGISLTANAHHERCSVDDEFQLVRGRRRFRKSAVVEWSARGIDGGSRRPQLNPSKTLKRLR